MGWKSGSTSATQSDADVKLEAAYLFPNICPCSYRDRRLARPSLREGTIGRCRESQRSKPRPEAGQRRGTRIPREVPGVRPH
jgi:hypothetical protein